VAWAEAEMSGIDLGDHRLNGRVVKLLERLSERPSASIARGPVSLCCRSRRRHTWIDKARGGAEASGGLAGAQPAQPEVE